MARARVFCSLAPAICPRSGRSQSEFYVQLVSNVVFKHEDFDVMCSSAALEYVMFVVSLILC